jgi:uncharacterized repeat protein (TIGR04052 family)
MALAFAVGLLATCWLANSCARPKPTPIEIPFEARIGGQPFSCRSAFGIETDGSAQLVANDLRFYVHNVELIDATGKAVAVTLTPDGVFQNMSLALLDFEDGTGSCENGTAATHTSITGTVPPGDYRALRFSLGVPFPLNHADPAVADPPLNLGRMHWGWQAGYKFLRFEAADAKGHGVRFHLGSTGCEGTIGHINRCARPNRPVVELQGFAVGRSRVVVQLESLLSDFDGDRTRSCMSDFDAADCRPMFAAVGIDAASGGATGVQGLFRLTDS